MKFIPNIALGTLIMETNFCRVKAFAFGVRARNKGGAQLPRVVEKEKG